ncbi:MAG: hypothetical protein K6F00_11105 [Lachnospiraceae bacterium]|nr:hypothetical protein [Lachnospiraceae bacterium]
MTWDEIYANAENCGYGSDELTAKDNARWEVGNLVYKKIGVDIEEEECPEEEVDDYVERWDIKFDKEGHIVSYKIC